MTDPIAPPPDDIKSQPIPVPPPPPVDPPVEGNDP